jgi:hypothetical protein
MTNPVAAMRMLIIYAILIPLAILAGYLLTDPLDYGSIGFIGLILLVLVSPIFIKWHYQILIFGLGCPAICFFLPGRPLLSETVVLLSLGISIVERTMNSDRRFLSARAITWPLLFIAAIVFMTAKLTGGIGFHSLGGDTGGGKKYFTVFIGIAAFFALTSRGIPAGQWKFYLALFMLPNILGVFGELAPYIPGSLKIINLFFPPEHLADPDADTTSSRLTVLSKALGVVPAFLLALYGLRGIFLAGKLWRPALFMAGFALALTGGYRGNFIGFCITLTLIFVLEGLHRSRLMAPLVLLGALGLAILATCSDKLPYTFQRSMSFLPFKWQPAVMLDAEGSTEWRLAIWRATWPKVPEHLLLGKGYALDKSDFDMIGGGEFSRFAASHIDAGDESLAISSDYHSGPLSTLMGFGVWGAIGILWLMAATLFVLVRNYKYGDPALATFNVYMLAGGISSVFAFFFIFGGFQGDVGNFARCAGISLAFNRGLAKRPAKQGYTEPLKPLPAGAVQAA